MSSKLANFTTFEVGELLKDNGFDASVCKVFVDNKIDGSILLELTSEDMKELGIKALGDRKKLERVMKLNVSCDNNSGNSCTGDQLMEHSGIQSAVYEGLMDSPNNSSDDCSSEIELPLQRRKRRRMEEHFDNDNLLESSGNQCEAGEDNSSDNGNEAVQNLPSLAIPPAAIIQGVPDRAQGWEDNFVVPKQYSASVMVALTTGRITSNVRSQIVQDVATKMLSFCKYPSPSQFETVAQSIVSCYPTLKDSMGPGHFSWTKALKDRFKNMRRLPRSSRTGLEFTPPSAKKRHTTTRFLPSGRLLDETTYQRHKTCLARSNFKSEGVLVLMNATAGNRRQWIKEKKPLVPEILQEFPCLKNYNVMVEEFKTLTMMEDCPLDKLGLNWEKIRGRIIEKCKLEIKPSMSTLLKYEDTDNTPEENKNAIALLLLPMLLDKKYKNNGDFLLIFLNDGDDPTAVISSKQNSPFAVAVGEDLLHITQFLVVAEREVLYDVDNFRKALFCIFMCYYVFDMSYPKEIMNTMLYLEKVLLGLPNLQKLSASAVAAVSAIDKL